jgi:hypothetical protein
VALHGLALLLVAPALVGVAITRGVQGALLVCLALAFGRRREAVVAARVLGRRGSGTEPVVHTDTGGDCFFGPRGQGSTGEDGVIWRRSEREGKETETGLGRPCPLVLDGVVEVLQLIQEGSEFGPVLVAQAEEEGVEGPVQADELITGGGAEAKDLDVATILRFATLQCAADFEFADLIALLQREGEEGGRINQHAGQEVGKRVRWREGEQVNRPEGHPKERGVHWGV